MKEDVLTVKWESASEPEQKPEIVSDIGRHQTFLGFRANLSHFQDTL